jgi:hypothetical protein
MGARTMRFLSSCPPTVILERSCMVAMVFACVCFERVAKIWSECRVGVLVAAEGIVRVAVVIPAKVSPEVDRIRGTSLRYSILKLSRYLCASRNRTCSSFFAINKCRSARHIIRHRCDFACTLELHLVVARRLETWTWTHPIDRESALCLPSPPLPKEFCRRNVRTRYWFGFVGGGRRVDHYIQHRGRGTSRVPY